ncbi:MAG: PHP domain-containing protein, partial [Candidatus Nanopelagicaceae bacterium]
MSFTHLHVASGYSFKYGTNLPDELVTRASELGMRALALTDRDTLAGAIRFTKSCETNSISPIIGIDIEYENQSRLTILATPNSWHSLVRLVTELKRLASPPTADFFANNERYTKNLLLLHGPNSEASRAILSRRYDKALALFNKTRDLFKDQALECVSHLEDEGIRSTIHAARTLGFARDNDLKALLSNAVRMRERSDAPIADILDATRNLLPLHHNVVERKNAEAFLKSSEEMAHLAEVIARAAGERNGKALLKTTKEWA